jgi:hypothetical protein
MTCPVCRQRKPRRECPALHQTICSICCGTKRLTEIACPDGCVHLAAAREHPAAAVKRQQERDVAILMPAIRHLTERQQQLFFLFHTVIVRHTPDGLTRLLDDDVADAAAAVAATLETAGRGVIYEHPASSLPAQKLATELKAMLEQMREQGAIVYDGEAAITLRSIEAGARDTRKAAPGGAGTDYLELMHRLLQANRAAARNAEPPPPASGLILP